MFYKQIYRNGSSLLRSQSNENKLFVTILSSSTQHFHYIQQLLTAKATGTNLLLRCQPHTTMNFAIFTVPFIAVFHRITQFRLSSQKAKQNTSGNLFFAHALKSNKEIGLFQLFSRRIFISLYAE